MRARNINSTFHHEATLFSDSFKEREVNTIKKTSYHKNYYPQEKSGICVVCHRGESFDELLKRFRKKYSKSGLAKELRDRMYYEKPSDKHRRKKAQSLRLIERENQKVEELRKKQEKFKNRKARLDAKKQRRERNHDSSSSR